MKKRKRLSAMLACIFSLFACGSMSVHAESSWPLGPEIQGEAAVVMEASTGTVLYEKNPHEQLYPASITKIMTTLLAIENCSLDEEVTFSYESVHNIDRTSTHIFRDVGEIMTMEQCLYAVMLGSANDCAYAVAEHAGNGYEHFIDMMNERAAGLGCTDTHFHNPHGLPDKEHYTSAYDMALISGEALKNDTFRHITGTKKYVIPFTNKHTAEETYIVNHHKMLTSYEGVTEFLYDGCIGGKTGFTSAAQNTLVTFAEKDGMTLICVVMKCPTNGQYKDTRALLNFCYDNFKVCNVAENESQFEVSGTADAKIFGTAGEVVTLDPKGLIVLPKTAEFSEASCQVVEADGTDGTVAELQYTYQDRAVGGTDIKIRETKVEPYPFHVPEAEESHTSYKINIKYIIIGIAAVILLVGIVVLLVYFIQNYYIIRHRRRTRRRQRRRFR